MDKSTHVNSKGLGVSNSHVRLVPHLACVIGGKMTSVRTTEPVDEDCVVSDVKGISFFSRSSFFGPIPRAYRTPTTRHNDVNTGLSF